MPLYQKEELYGQKLALGAGFFAMLFASQSVMVMAIPFYQMTLGVDPFLLSMAFSVPIITGILLTPWIGYLSDQCTSRWGRRRPFIFWGSLLSTLLYGSIWMVPIEWPVSLQLGYFAVIYLFFYLASIFVAVPTTSLSYELSDEPAQRRSIMATTTFFIKSASLLYQWLFPIANLAIFSSVIVGIRWVGWSVGIVFIGLMGLIPALLCKEQSPKYLRQHYQSSYVSSYVNGFVASFMPLFRHKPLLLLMTICFLQMGGSAFAATMDYYLLVYFVSDGDISEGAIWKGVLSSAYAIAGFASIPLISWLSAKFDKYNALAWVLSFTVIGGLAKWFLFVPGIGWWITLDALLCTSVWTAMTTLIPAFNADLSDRQSTLQGRPTAGIFAAAYSSVSALAGIIAMTVSGASLNLIGFDASLANAQSEQTILAMRLILAGGTILFGILSLLCLHCYRMSSKNLNDKPSLAQT